MTLNISDMEYWKFVTCGSMATLGSVVTAVLLVGMSGTNYIPIQVSAEGRIISVSGA